QQWRPPSLCGRDSQSTRWRCCAWSLPSDLPATGPILFAAAGWLFPDPTQKRPQFRSAPQIGDARIPAGQRRVGVGRMHHAVTLRTQQLDILDSTAVLPRQAVMPGQVAALKEPAAQGTGYRLLAVLHLATQIQTGSSVPS